MSKFGEPTECRNKCGQFIYFDRNSEKGHPSNDRWIPLQYDKESGIKTDEPHQCPKNPFYTKGQGQTQQPQQHQVQVQMSRQPQPQPQQQSAHGELLTGNIALEVKLLQQKIDRLVSLLEQHMGVSE